MNRFILLMCLMTAAWTVNNSAYVGATQTPKQDKSPATQAKRLDFIKRLQASKFIGDVQPPRNGIVRAFVTPSFMAGDYKDKANVVSVIYLYYFDGTKSTDLVILLDSKSGNEVGTYGLTRGLKMK